VGNAGCWSGGLQCPNTARESNPCPSTQTRFIAGPSGARERAVDPHVGQKLSALQPAHQEIDAVMVAPRDSAWQSNYLDGVIRAPHGGYTSRIGRHLDG
jgi:hypothetical protein